MFNKLEWQRNYRKINHNKHTNEYEKTPSGFLVRKYRNMLSRVSGVQKKKHHLYKDLDILPKDEFYSWAMSNDIFWNMFKVWEKNNYKRGLCPTVDRIDPTKGYILENMQWLTHSENSAKIRRNTS